MESIFSKPSSLSFSIRRLLINIIAFLGNKGDMKAVMYKKHIGGLKMKFTDIFLVLVIYSGLIVYFLMPFTNNLENQKRHSFMQNLKQLILHKKAIFALLIFVFVLVNALFVISDRENHINAHSGYPAISMDLYALYFTVGIVIYTVILTLAIAKYKTLKQNKLQ